MSNELTMLTWVVTLNAIMWMPYVVNTILVRGIMDAVGYPKEPKPLSGWATRMKAAHYNAVENLVVFAALVLIADSASVSNEITATACTVYFWARVLHLLAYTFAIPWVRTVSFIIGWACQIALILQLL